MAGIKGQKHNLYIEGKYAHVNKNDVVFTPDDIAKAICETFQPLGKVLEPCKGEGAFMQFLPANSDWCEIAEGRNFYDYNQKVDWIVTNPPYSDFNRFLDHSFNLADNIVLLVPIAKIFKSMKTIDIVFRYGGIVACFFIGAHRCGFPFGFPCGIFYFKRNYYGPTTFMSFYKLWPQLQRRKNEHSKK